MATTSSFTTGSPPFRLGTSWPSPVTALVAVAGEVDLATAPALRDWALGVLDEHAPAFLGVDLAEVTFLDCAGISALVEVRNAAVLAGHRMWIVHPQPIVRRVLKVTGLLGMLTAPIDQPPATGPGLRPRADPSLASTADPPGVLAPA